MANQAYVISRIWVPGYKNIIGNCIADEFARKSTTNPFQGELGGIGVPIAFFNFNLWKPTRVKNSFQLLVGLPHLALYFKEKNIPIIKDG